MHLFAKLEFLKLGMQILQEELGQPSLLCLESCLLTTVLLSSGPSFACTRQFASPIWLQLSRDLLEKAAQVESQRGGGLELDLCDQQAPAVEESPARWQYKQ
jgi:hypothetical protein